MNNERTHLCPKHNKAWIDVPASSCPWCEIERLQAKLDEQKPLVEAASKFADEYRKTGYGPLSFAHFASHSLLTEAHDKLMRIVLAEEKE